MAATGRCLCGAVRFEVRGTPRDVVVCHCGECRRWAGHVWAASAAPREDVEILEDGALRWIDSPESVTHARRGFCSECGSSLFWEAPGPGDDQLRRRRARRADRTEDGREIYTEFRGDYYG